MKVKISTLYDVKRQTKESLLQVSPRLNGTNKLRSFQLPRLLTPKFSNEIVKSYG